MTAANPHVDLCEQDPESTRRINVDAVEYVARACAETGSNLMFFSTDYVFDGADGPYDESAEPRPLSEYGRQKLAAEDLVREILPGNHVIARINVVYGWEKHGKNFFVRLLRNLRFGEEATIPDDQFSTPTYVGDIAHMAWDIVEADGRGLFHLTGPDFMNRHRFSKTIAITFDCDPSLVKPVATAALGQGAPRPMLGGLVSNRISDLTDHEPRSVKSALELLYEQESILAGG
jgi:dTDP-4-dehydrorhamnose reductase